VAELWVGWPGPLFLLGARGLGSLLSLAIITHRDWVIVGSVIVVVVLALINWAGSSVVTSSSVL